MKTETKNKLTGLLFIGLGSTALFTAGVNWGLYIEKAKRIEAPACDYAIYTDTLNRAAKTLDQCGTTSDNAFKALDSAGKAVDNCIAQLKNCRTFSDSEGYDDPAVITPFSFGTPAPL